MRDVGDRSTQHRPVPHGKYGFLASSERVQREYPGKRVHIARLLAEGDFVVLHTHKESPGDADWTRLDIFRFEAERIVAHRDVLQHVRTEAANHDTKLEASCRA